MMRPKSLPKSRPKAKATTKKAPTPSTLSSKCIPRTSPAAKSEKENDSSIKTTAQYYKTEIQRLEKELSLSAVDLVQQREQNNRLISTITNQHEVLESTTQQLEHLITYSKTTKETNFLLKQEIKNLSHLLNTNVTSNKEHVKHIEKLGSRIVALEKGERQLKTENEVLQQLMEDRNKIHDTEMEVFKEKVKELEFEVSQCTIKLESTSSVQEQLHIYKSDCNRLKTQNIFLKTQLSHHQQQIISLKSQLTQQQKTIKITQNKLHNEEISNKVDRITRENVISRLDNLQGVISHLQSEVVGNLRRDDEYERLQTVLCELKDDYINAGGVDNEESTSQVQEEEKEKEQVDEFMKMFNSKYGKEVGNDSKKHDVTFNDAKNETKLFTPLSSHSSTQHKPRIPSTDDVRLLGNQKSQNQSLKPKEQDTFHFIQEENSYSNKMLEQFSNRVKDIEEAFNNI